MSVVALALNLMLACLLIAALAYGRRLDGRLKAVRDGQVAFTRAVADLDVATVRARQGLDELRTAAEEATDLLGSRVTRAREAAERLEKLLGRADAVPEPKAVETGGLAALIAELNARERQAVVEPERAPRLFERQPPRAPRPSVDEDLFAEPGGRA